LGPDGGGSLAFGPEQVGQYSKALQIAVEGKKGKGAGVLKPWPNE